jgi:hypothetical protein
VDGRVFPQATFFKSSDRVHNFLRSALDTSLEDVSLWWQPEKHGLFTNGDQDKILYRLENQTNFSVKTKIISWDIFNFRPYHFNESSNEHFLVHFAVPGTPKEVAIFDFMVKYGFSDASLTTKI